MPSKTAKQHRAMAAACGGHSTLGIPQDVGCEFVAHDKKSGKRFKVKGRKTAKKRGR